MNIDILTKTQAKELIKEEIAKRMDNLGHVLNKIERKIFTLEEALIILERRIKILK